MWGKAIAAFFIGTFFGIPILSFVWHETQKHAASALHSATTVVQHNATSFLSSHIASWLAQVVK